MNESGIIGNKGGCYIRKVRYSKQEWINLSEEEITNSLLY